MKTYNESEIKKLCQSGKACRWPKLHTLSYADALRIFAGAHEAQGEHAIAKLMREAADRETANQTRKEILTDE